jgi:hypothetical protein
VFDPPVSLPVADDEGNKEELQLPQLHSLSGDTMAKDWYYTKDGERFGPVTARQLKSIADSGELQSTDLVWNSEMPDWKTAKSVTGLFETTGRPTAMQPSPVSSNVEHRPPVLASTSPTNQLDLIAKTKTKFSDLETPQKILFGCAGSMGVFLFLCMGMCGLGGLIGDFDGAQDDANDSEQHQSADHDDSSESQSPAFSEGLAVVQREGVWCVIDESMKTVGEVGVNSGAEFRPFSNGRAVYYISYFSSDDPESVVIHAGAIDRSGKDVIPPDYTRMSDFKNDRAVVWKGTLRDHRSGIIDKQGRFILPLTNRYDIGPVGGGEDEAFDTGFSEGLVFFLRNDPNDKGLGLGGFLDREGRVAISPEKIVGGLASPGLFSEGLAAVERGMTQAESRSGFLPVGVVQMGYIDRTGKQVIKPQFSAARIFSEGLASVQRRNEKWGYIDKTGQMVIEPQFDWANPFKNGHASVTIDGNEKVIDRTGRIVR